MKYALKAFVFDTDQLLLMCEGELVSFRLNEAKLLALFLSDPQKLFSKEEILDKVWAGKFVAEQAVFQNIRNLRAIFGEESIKTFSKKGYQWQLPITPVYDDPDVNSVAVSEHEVRTANAFRRSGLASILLGAFVVLAALGWWQFKMNIAPPLPMVALIPLIADQEVPPVFINSLGEGLRNAGQFKAVVFDAQKVSRDFIWAPQKYFQTITQSTRAPYVFMGRVSRQAGSFRLRYLLKSSKNSWRADYHASSAEQLVRRVNIDMGRILDSGLLDIDEQDALLLGAKLKLLQAQYPYDLNLQQALINFQTQRGDAANGIVLAKELQEKAAQQQDQLFVAKGQLAAANAYIHENLLTDAELLLANAEAGFQAIGDWESLVEVGEGRISVAFARNDYQQIKRDFQRTLEFARRSGDVIKEYRLNGWAAVLAHKFSQTDERWSYLSSAEAVLDQHQQAPEFYALIHFYAGMFEQDAVAAEKRYRKVLTLLPASQNWWERERAQAHLGELLITQSRWQDALDLYADQPLGASQELLVGNIWKAQQNWTKAEVHGAQSFKQANLNGQLPNALDAALYLLQLDKQLGRPANSFYHQFLLKEAGNVPHWVKFNQSKLADAGLELPKS